MKNLLLLSVMLLCLYCSGQNELPRRAYWGIEYKDADDSGVQLTSVSPDYSFGSSGLKEGDIILTIDDSKIEKRSDLRAKLRGRIEGDQLRISFNRDGKVKRSTVTATPFPYEKVDGIDFEYGSFKTSAGDHLRTIVSKPTNSTGKLPTVLFIQWLSCDPIDVHPLYKDGNMQLIHDLSSAGYLVMRTEKPGVGDSQGRDCGSYGFNEEIKVHQEALEVLRNRTDVDTNQIILFGSSIGGTMAPIIAQGQSLKGLIVTGCYYKTWYEHMLEIERRISFLSGDSPKETNEKMKLWSKFYSYYLNDKMAPGEIIDQYPEFKKVWKGPPNHQYGRPVSFYMEANDHNIPAYWGQIDVPTMVIYGEYDYIMSGQDHRMIAEALNRKKEGQGTYLELAGADHGLTIYKDQQAAFDSFSPKYDQTLTKEVLAWLKKL